MVLIVGGAYQGKKEYADHTFPEVTRIVSGKAASIEELIQAERIDDLHLWIRTRLVAGGDPMEEINKLLLANRDVVILMDEIGCGVVPLDPFENQYRETVGRIGCLLAAQSEKVIRVMCGIGTEIKG